MNEVVRGLDDGAASGGRPPRVSVIMANFRGEKYLAEAIASVLRQDMADLELLIADDGSDDASPEIVRAAEARDPRVRLLPGTRSEGPSAARNRALAEARGEWVAIMDSDDLLHPRRFQILLDAAYLTGADMIADDLLFFGDALGTGGRTLLGALRLDAALPVGPELFVRSNDADADLPAMGYLKPLIRRSAMGDLRYDPAVRVGEDYDLYIRLLLSGPRFVVVPLPLYLYRRHAASLSHRLSVAALTPLVAAHETVVAGLGDDDPALGLALSRRGRSLARALRFEELVAAVKARAVGTMAGLVLRDPALIPLLAGSLRERLERRAHRRAPAADAASVGDVEGQGPARIMLVSEGAEGPPNAADADRRTAVGAASGAPVDPGRDGVLAAPPIGADRLDVGPALHALACKLSEMASRRPVEVTVVGPKALDALALLPAWQSAVVWLTREEETALTIPLPPGAVLRTLPLTS